LDASDRRFLAADARAALKHKLRWRFNRLRCMTPLEMAHRLLRAAQAAAERSGLIGCPAAPAADLTRAGTPWIAADARVERTPYVDAAERIGAGRLDIFALRDVDLGTPPRWNRDPKTGIEAPLAFGKTLDYRDPNLVGDIKYLWEPNRHLHLVTLAQAYALEGEQRHFHTLAEHLDSWLLACPYGLGPNWASALEAAIRLVNWAIAWQLLGGPGAPVFDDRQHAGLRERWLRAVYQHAEFVRGWLSRHSSANNHLIGEAAGLYLAGLAWPHWERSAVWMETGRRLLEREALAQNAPDGVNREQAVAYQQFVLDFLLLCLLAGRANGRPFSADYEARVQAMLDYLASIMDAGGNVPQFGDADDGCVARLGLDDTTPYKSLLALGAILFRRGDFKVKAGPLDDRARWLLGSRADQEYAALDAAPIRLPPRLVFPHGGYYVLACDLERPTEIRVVADAGPLGYRSIAAHGHADALSFTLSAGGAEFLIDPGTYAYHTQGAWRRYFRGTSAHNTIRIDGEDQSVQGGNFLWLNKAAAGCSLSLSTAGKDIFEGWHDGYLRLGDPVRHRRLIELDKVARRVLVEDTLEMAEDHDVELFFHCDERCVLRPIEHGFVLQRAHATVRLLLPQVDKARTLVHRGSLAPMSGWVSRAFDVRQPTATIVWQARLTGRTVLRTELLVQARTLPADASGLRPSD
jgi:hypothetical protein